MIQWIANNTRRENNFQTNSFEIDSLRHCEIYCEFKILNLKFFRADIAQLVEHIFCKDDVRGSIPRVGSD